MPVIDSTSVFTVAPTPAVYATDIQGTGVAAQETGLTKTLTVGSLAPVIRFDDTNKITGIGLRAAQAATGTSITAVGVDAASENTGSNVTVSGVDAAYQNTGSNVTVVGVNAARQNTGSNVAVVGVSAAFENTGSNVTASGVQAAFQNIGSNVTASGVSAAYKNTGSNVTASGDSAAYQNTGANVTASGFNAVLQNTGTNVTASGVQAAFQNTGSNVTVSGVNAAYQNTGSNVTVVGISAGQSASFAAPISISGFTSTTLTVVAHGFGAAGVSKRVILGGTAAPGGLALSPYIVTVVDANTVSISGVTITSAGTAATLAVNTIDQTNSTMLGANSAVTGPNQVQLGDAATTTYVYGTVQNRSDKRDKADIRDTTLGLDFVLALRPVDYRWDLRSEYFEEREVIIPATDHSPEQRSTVRVPTKPDGSKKRMRFHHGFLAQDPALANFGGLQDHSKNGGADVMSIGYDEFIAPLVKAIQELSAKLDAQATEFAAYRAAHP